MDKIDIYRTEFKNNYPNNFITYTSKGRHMQLAWSGSPDKPALLFIHGSPGSYETWAKFLVSKHLQTQFHLLAVNRPGYEGSGGGISEPSIKLQSDEIIDALRFNQSGKKAIVIGYSFGATVAAKMILDHPEKFSGAILIAGSYRPSLEIREWYNRLASLPPISWLLPESFRVSNEEGELLKTQLSEMETSWKSLKVPVILLHGGKDNIVNSDNLKFLKTKIEEKLILNSIFLPNMDHYIPWERPDLILDSIHLIQLHF